MTPFSPRRLASGLTASAIVTTMVAAGLLAGAAGASAQDTGTVRVVHGIPDTPVDVYVDGERAIDDFQPGSVQGPLELPAGSLEVAIFPADAADGSGEPLLSATAEVAAGASATLVAHLSEAGEPTVTPFVDDVDAVPAGQARLVVRHTAAAPAVDVLAGGTAVLSGLTNPNQEALVTDAGTVPAAVAAAGTTEPVIGPADLDLAEGSATFVHAIGSLEADNLDLVVFTVDGLHSSPSGVPSGAPSGAPYDGAPVWPVALIALAGGAAVVFAVRARRGEVRRWRCSVG